MEILVFAIKRRTPTPHNPLNGTIFHPFLPHFFLLQLYLTYMKQNVHLVSVENINFKSPYNWFKIDIFRLLRPPTAI